MVCVYSDEGQLYYAMEHACAAVDDINVMMCGSEEKMKLRCLVEEESTPKSNNGGWVVGEQ